MKLKFVLSLLLAAAGTQAAPVPQRGAVPTAPPPALPAQTRPAPTGPQPLGLTPYAGYGLPTDEEQLYLEYLNRMRANPTAEGQRLATTTDPNVLSAYSYFGVNLSLLQSEFATNPAAPPVAMNGKLLAAARWHSGDMYTNMYQGHFQTNGLVVMSPQDRISSNGYNWTFSGENVYATAQTVFYGHAGFAVDWGPGPGGMQTPAGHRENMLDPTFREVGMGVFDGVNGSVGPQLITQDFATSFGATPLITGVVYYDLNGNGFYDVGEGIGGVKVDTAGSAYYATTADSGGYAIPVTTNGSYTLTFTASGLSNRVVANVSGLNNVKADYVPAYAPPVISGPNPASQNTSNHYTFTPVGAATAYQWRQSLLSAFTTVEGAENGLGDFTATTSPGYSVVSTDEFASGTHSYNLAHEPDPTNPDDQILTLNPALRVNANSQLTFAKYLTYAFSNEVARAQISTNGGLAWQDVWTEAGNAGGVPVDSGFATTNISLGAYAGQVLQVRFVYSYYSGYYYTPPQAGLYLDNIAVSNSEQLSGTVTNAVASGTAFTFYPTNTTNYLLAVRAQINSRTLSWGPALRVGVTTPPPSLQVVGAPTISGTQVQLDFTVTNYRAGMTFQLWKVSDLTGAWAQDPSASLSTLIANSKFRFTTMTGGAARTFYRVRGSY